MSNHSILINKYMKIHEIEIGRFFDFRLMNLDESKKSRELRRARERSAGKQPPKKEHLDPAGNPIPRTPELKIIDNQFPSGWKVYKTSAFRTGFTRYRTDPEVMVPLLKLMNEAGKGIPMLQLPPEFNTHVLSRNFKGFSTSHLKGRRIVLIWKYDISTKIVELQCLGTHSDCRTAR